MLRCRRCYSRHLLRLEKKHPQDNDVLGCVACGFLFSPSVNAADANSVRSDRPSITPLNSMAKGDADAQK